MWALPPIRPVVNLLPILPSSCDSIHRWWVRLPPTPDRFATVTTSFTFLKAGPAARHKHHGHRATGPTLHPGGTTRIRQPEETELTGSGPPSTPPDQASYPTQAVHYRGRPHPIPC